MTTESLIRDGELAAKISNTVVRALSRTTGRGPTKAKTTLGPNGVFVVLQDTLTRGEQTLADAGAHARRSGPRGTLERNPVLKSGGAGRQRCTITRLPGLAQQDVRWSERTEIRRHLKQSRAADKGIDRYLRGSRDPQAVGLMGGEKRRLDGRAVDRRSGVSTSSRRRAAVVPAWYRLRDQMCA